MTTEIKQLERGEPLDQQLRAYQALHSWLYTEVESIVHKFLKRMHDQGRYKWAAFKFTVEDKPQFMRFRGTLRPLNNGEDKPAGQWGVMPVDRALLKELFERTEDAAPTPAQEKDSRTEVDVQDELSRRREALKQPERVRALMAARAREVAALAKNIGETFRQLRGVGVQSDMSRVEAAIGELGAAIAQAGDLAAKAAEVAS